MINCGFFNSIDNDRPYNAEQMNNPYKRLVSNGVFAKPDGEKSDDFKVYTNGGMSVLVSAGDGIFDYKWANNTAPYEIAVPMADLYNDRIDSVIFRVNYVDRVGELILVEGVASDNPIAPELIRNEKYVDYRLANISVKTGVLAISAIDIVDTRATTDCGFVTHLLQQSDITETYSNWQAQFDAWFLNLKETIATTTIISSFSSKFIATKNTTEVPINVDNYNSVLDILQVYKDGLLLVENYDYTVNDFNTITLNEEIAADTQIAFVVYKSVDGSEAESFIRDMEELFKRIKVVENSFDTLESNVESKLDNFETRIDALEADPSVLWTGANTMGDGQTINPSKKLSKCKNGWILAWSAYTPESGVATDSRFSFTYVPKKLMNAVSNGSFDVCSGLIHALGNDGTIETAAKRVYISDTQITGYAGNTAGTYNGKLALRFIYEY